jgi:high-affinity nickel permease
MNFAMCVTVGLEISGLYVDELAMRETVWFEISGISKDELRHAGYCVVGDFRYIYR